MTKKQPLFLLVLASLFSLNFPTVSRAQQLPEEVIRYADMVFHNGYVLTVDTDRGDFTIAEAVAIRDGRILAVGSNEKALRLAGPKTQKIDLNKRAVMPGIIDTHVHPNRYAIRNYFRELPPEDQKALRASGVIREWKDKAQVLNQIKQIVEKEDPSKEWIAINVGGGGFGSDEGGGGGLNEVAASITRFDLDKVCPNKPLVISSGTWDGMVNSKGLEKLLAIYGQHMPGVLKDSKGVATGQLRGAPVYILRTEVLPQVSAEGLAPIFAKELRERWAPLGHTTISTRLNANEIRAYALLDVKGELPLRVAYGHEIGRWNPFFERDMKRNLGVVLGYGSDMLWMNAITVAPPDGSPPDGDICSTYPKRELFAGDVFPEGRCRWDEPGDMTRETIRLLMKYGFRVANIHTYGDKGLEAAVDLFERYGGAGKRFALDHSALFNPNVLKKSGQLGMYWSVAAQKFLEDPEMLAKAYGREVTNSWAFPLRALIEAGAKVTYEASARRGNPKLTPFFDMEMFVTRRDGKGNVWGAHHALDRKTVIRMMTRWGAEYVLREKVLGSIEPGKFADLIVLDKNPLDPALPDEELSEIKILMTMVGGKVVYQAPELGL